MVVSSSTIITLDDAYVNISFGFDNLIRFRRNFSWKNLFFIQIYLWISQFTFLNFLQCMKIVWNVSFAVNVIFFLQGVCLMRIKSIFEPNRFHCINAYKLKHYWKLKLLKSSESITWQQFVNDFILALAENFYFDWCAVKKSAG